MSPEALDKLSYLGLLLATAVLSYAVSWLRSKRKNLKRNDEKQDVELEQDKTENELRGVMTKAMKSYLDRIELLEGKVAFLERELVKVQTSEKAALQRAAEAELQVDLLMEKSKIATRKLAEAEVKAADGVINMTIIAPESKP